MRRLLCLVLLLPAFAAQGVSQTGGIGMSFDPSVRASGMGGAGAGVFWGGGPDYWANPALLGYYDGIHANLGKTQLVPSLADDVFFKTRRFVFAHWGLGIAISKWGFGETKLEQGTQTLTDSGGNVIGTVEAEQRIETIGFGFSFGRFARAMAAMQGGEFPLAGLADVSVGYVHKRLEDELGPSPSAPGEPTVGKGVSQDVGVLLRISPVNTFDAAAADLFPVALRRIGLRVDLSYGYSIQGFDDGVVIFPQALGSDPLARVSRWGGALRLAGGGTELARELTGERYPAFLTPLLSVAFARDAVEETALLDGQRAIIQPSTQYGWEITLLNLFSWRRGFYDERAGSITGSTSGWSLGVEHPDFGGIRYDESTWPQAPELPELDRRAVEVWVDVLGISRWARAR